MKRVKKGMNKGDCCGGWNWSKNGGNWHGKGYNGSGGFGYFLGFIGAAVYYISMATSFWGGVVGFLKALVWPAFLVFELLKFLAM